MFFPSSESVQIVLRFDLPSINVLWCFAASIFGLRSIIPSIAPPAHQKSLIHLSECLQYVFLIYPFHFSVFFSMFFSMLLFYFLLLSFLMHSFTILHTFHSFLFFNSVPSSPTSGIRSDECSARNPIQRHSQTHQFTRTHQSRARATTPNVRVHLEEEQGGESFMLRKNNQCVPL